MTQDLEETAKMYRKHKDTRLLPVILDGKHLRLDHRKQPIAIPCFTKNEKQVSIPADKITLAACRVIARHYKGVAVCVSDWRFYNRDNLNEYTPAYLQCADLQKIDAKVIKVDYRYNLKTNIFLVYRNNIVVYESNNGLICFNPDILAKKYNEQN